MSQKIPLVLLACGSFNPITNAHLRMFELAKDYFNSFDKYNVISGYISPVSDGYKKKGLVSASQRCDMVKLAVKNSNWINLSDWESSNSNWTFTLEVLNYHHKLIQESYGTNAHLMFLCGGDIVESFNIPNLWKDEHINEIISKFGLVVIKRHGSNPEKLIYESDLLYNNRHNIHLITDWITNEISSTRIRRAISRNESVKYLINDNVEQYIKENNLYKN